MRAWRVIFGAGLILVIALPLIFPFLELSSLDRLALDWSDLPRLGSLTCNSFLLVLGTLLLALPLGVLLAVLLFRTDLPIRGVLLPGMLLLLFVPVPVQVSAWQGLLGQLPVWGTETGRMWARGLAPAVWVHGVAALPWVILIVGVALAWVERELEEEALLAARPWRVIWRVTVPRCRGGIAAAALWVGLLTASDISVTDMFLVPTLAEEMQIQFTMSGPESVTRTLRLCWPGLAALFLLVLILTPRLQRALPPLQNPQRPPVTFPLGKARCLWIVAIIGLALALVLFPLGSLIWKLGQAGQPRSWSGEHAWMQLHGVVVLYGWQVALNLAAAAFTGLVTAALALVACWLALESRGWRCFLLFLMALGWTMPGPLAGVGLQRLIQALTEWEPAYHLLYYQSSALPTIWAHIMRFFPFAALVMWPVVRLVPLELRDAARLEGARPGQELLYVYVPLTARAFVGAAAAVTALALGEVGAAARVDTPGWDNFAKLIFDRMHYGVENNVAALCLLLLGAVSSAYLIGAAAVRRFVK